MWMVLAFEHGAPGDCFSPERNRPASHERVELRRHPVGGGVLIGRSLLPHDGRHVRLAKAGCRFNEHIEHSLKVEGRAADDLEHIGGDGLLLQ